MDPTSPFDQLLIEFLQLPNVAEQSAFAEQNTLFGQLMDLPTLPSDAERRAFLLDNPVCLSPSVLQYLLEVPPLASAYRPLLPEFGVVVDDTPAGLSISTNDRSYPLGKGPIEKLWKRVESGSRSLEETLLEAHDSSLAARLSPIYVSALSAANIELMSRDLRLAVARQRLVVEVTESVEKDLSLFDAVDAWKIRKWAGVAWVQVAASALQDAPDGRVFHHALSLGEDLILESGDVWGDEEFLGRILHRMGILYLEPYVAGRTSTKYHEEMLRWRARLRERLGDLAAEVETQWPMPEPLEALERATYFLSQACDHRVAAKRGISLAAMANALLWQRLIGGNAEVAAIRAVAEEALSVLDPRENPAAVQQAREALSVLDRLSTPPPSVRLSSLSLRQLAPEADEREHATVMEWMSQLDAIIGAEVPTLASDPMTAYRSLPASKGPSRKLSAVAALVASCLVSHKEAEGVQILDDADLQALARDLNCEAPLAWLRSLLLLNEGAGLFADKDYEGALRCDLRALEGLATLHLEGHMVACLHRLVEFPRPADVIEELIVGLYNAALIFERHLSTRSLSLIQHACRMATAAALPGSAGAVFLLWQVAKGLRFATTLNRGIAELVHVNGPDWRSLESLWLRLVDSGGAEDDPSATKPDELSLFTYAAISGGSSGEPTTIGMFRQRFDQTLEKLLVEAALVSRRLPNELVPLITLEQVQGYLDDTTVLAVFYIGRSSKGTLAIYLMLLTRERSCVAMIDHDSPYDRRFEAPEDFALDLAHFTAELRTQIQTNPPRGAVATEDALERLETSRHMLFAGAVEVLEEMYQQGKRHLCFVPHGPLHFFPFHLVDGAEGPLGAHWSVTYLPNLHLLGLDSRRPQAPIDRHEGVGVFAVDRVIAPRFPDIAEAIDEANAIAEVFETEPLVNDGFDKERFVAELTSGRRYIHIGSHGEMDVAAPSFHYVLLSPRAGVDQRFFAHELRSLDLRGIELLTLSACETAMGRFDIGDNLRGLPAYFLLAGVSAIVATMWEVETNASRTFFTTLYQQLKADRRRLNAFTIAQRATREQHPEYRDWGAFCYLGNFTEGISKPESRSVPGISSLQFNSPISRE